MARGLTQKDVAQGLGVYRRTTVDWEAGRFPNLKTDKTRDIFHELNDIRYLISNSSSYYCNNDLVEIRAFSQKNC